MPDDEKEPSAMNYPAAREAVESVVKVYGPFAFGLVTLLVIWLAIIQPELDSKRIDYEEHRKVLDRLGEENKANETTARTLRDTAMILERVVGRLEDLTKSK